MDLEQSIQDLIKSTIRRAIRESVAGAVAVIMFTSLLQHSAPGTAEYYGCLLVLVSTSFIFGVIWSHTLSYSLLRTHPVSDTLFWREAFLVQARLLRLVPLWYVAPLASALLVLFASGPARFTTSAMFIALVFALCARVVWMNRCAATEMEHRAATFGV